MGGLNTQPPPNYATAKKITEILAPKLTEKKFT